MERSVMSNAECVLLSFTSLNNSFHSPLQINVEATSESQLPTTSPRPDTPCPILPLKDVHGWYLRLVLTSGSSSTSIRISTWRIGNASKCPASLKACLWETDVLFWVTPKLILCDLKIAEYKMGYRVTFIALYAFSLQNWANGIIVSEKINFLRNFSSRPTFFCFSDLTLWNHTVIHVYLYLIPCIHMGSLLCVCVCVCVWKTPVLLCSLYCTGNCAI